ncbi:MAG TPA: hypothetical protein VEW28_02340 [Candidatus Kapabacteria bacterium]|nr:hypothetical protein [Candidatus Kapabacteria bacterium]
MRVSVFFRWEGATLEQYDALRQIVKWEEDVAAGAVVHICSHDGKSLRITDVWESAEDFNAFVDNRLMPAVKEVGIEGEPEVEIYPLHTLFAAAFEESEMEMEVEEETEA